MSKQDTDLDRRFMLRAIALARRGEGRVEPNPMVGCVIARGANIVAEGWHRRFGGPHAEVVALRTCADAARGATVYVSLEPCCHQGKTPPCVDALIAARPKRVAVAVRDPFPAMRGRGISALRRSGIQVDVGLCAEEARRVLAPFLTRQLLHRPFVITKWAQSLDGMLATHTGDSQWISGEESRRLVHKLRARVDAVMIGAGTMGRDDPLLTARMVPTRRVATRVVLDGTLRISIDSAMVGSLSVAPVIVFTTRKAATSPKADRLRALGVTVLPARTFGQLQSVPDVLRQLWAGGATNVLVEGGVKLLASFWRAGVVDESWVFVAPKLIGGDRSIGKAVPAVGRMSDAETPINAAVQRVGDDVLWKIRWTKPPLAAAAGT